MSFPPSDQLKSNRFIKVEEGPALSNTVCLPKCSAAYRRLISSFCFTIISLSALWQVLSHLKLLLTICILLLDRFFPGDLYCALSSLADCIAWNACEVIIFFH